MCGGERILPWTCLKVSLVISHLVLLLTSAGLLALAVLCLAKTGFCTPFRVDVASVGTPDLHAKVVLALSVAIVLVSLVGLCSAAADNVACLPFAAGLLILAVLGLMTMVGIEQTFRERVDQRYRDVLNYTVEYYVNGKEDIYFTRSWNILQTEYKCCGIGDSKPWEAWRRCPDFSSTSDLPATCCKDANVLCSSKSLDIVYQDDCYKKSLPDIKEKTLWSMIGMCVVAGVCVVCIVLAFCAYCSESFVDPDDVDLPYDERYERYERYNSYESQPRLTLEEKQKITKRYSSYYGT